MNFHILSMYRKNTFKEKHFFFTSSESFALSLQNWYTYFFLLVVIPELQHQIKLLYFLFFI